MTTKELEISISFRETVDLEDGKTVDDAGKELEDFLIEENEDLEGIEVEAREIVEENNDN